MNGPLSRYAECVRLTIMLFDNMSAKITFLLLSFTIMCHLMYIEWKSFISFTIFNMGTYFCCNNFTTWDYFFLIDLYVK